MHRTDECEYNKAYCTVYFIWKNLSELTSIKKRYK